MSTHLWPILTRHTKNAMSAGKGSSSALTHTHLPDVKASYDGSLCRLCTCCRHSCAGTHHRRRHFANYYIHVCSGRITLQTRRGWRENTMMYICGHENLLDVIAMKMKVALAGSALGLSFVEVEIKRQSRKLRRNHTAWLKSGIVQ